MDDQKPEEEEKRRLPDFIYVDAEPEPEFKQSKFGAFEHLYFESVKNLEGQHFSFTTRATCLLGALTLLAVVILAIPFMLLFFGINVLTFFKAEDFWFQTKKLWNYIKMGLIGVLGLAVAVFSPAFGMAIVMVYIMLRGKQIENEFIMKVMKSRLNK